MGRIRVGLSGWSYPAWAGRFYPDGLPAGERLAFVADIFDTVEVNRTFYALLAASVFQKWRETVPAGFTFAVKGGRYITHQKKLREVEAPLGNFFSSGVLLLGDKLGPIIWQLPGNWRFDAERVERFLGMLPGSFEEAVAVAARHDDRLDEPAIPDPSPRRIRHVLEVRHPSAFVPELVAMARAHGVALAVSDGADWRLAEEPTAGFMYVRLHGPGKLYSSEYEPPQIRHWAERAKIWKRGDEPSGAERITERVAPRRNERDVYVYFDNDVNAYAPADAQAFLGALDD